jgi:fibronectin-binding autotransporter adhesin
MNRGGVPLAARGKSIVTPKPWKRPGRNAMAMLKIGCAANRQGSHCGCGHSVARPRALSANHGLAVLLAVAAAFTHAAAANAAPFTWTSSGTSPLEDGGGDWNATGGTNWFDGTNYGAWGNTNADTATFGVGSGAAGTITVDGVTANGITFNSAGSGNYTLSSGTITMAGTTPTITVNASGTTTLTSRLAGSAGLTKTGAGTLLLGTANFYTGTTTITQGMVSVASRDNTLGNGNGGSVLLNGGGIEISSGTAAVSTLWSITIGAGGGTLQNSSGYGWTPRNTLSGSGTLTLKGPNNFSMAATQNSFSGKWVIDGVFIDQAQNSWGTGSGDDHITLVNNATLFSRGGTLASATQGITILSGTGIFNNAQFSVAATTIPAKLSGAGAARFIPTNGAIITLTNTGNSYAGDTVVSGVTTNRGFLRLGASEVVPDGPGKGNVFIFNNGAPASLNLNGFSETVNGLSSLNLFTSTYSTDSQVDNLLASSTATLTVGGNNASQTFAGVIQNSQSGSNAILALTKIGSGTQTLSGANTYWGPTTINGGVLELGAGGTTGSLSGSSAVTIASDAALAFRRSNSYGNFGNAISGAGGVILTSGTVTFTGSNSYTGSTTVNGGVLVAGSANAFGESTAALVINSGTASLGGFSVAVGPLSGSSGGVLTTSNVAGTATFTTNVGSGTSTFAGSIANNGSGLVALTKQGSGRLVFSGNNTYSGATEISAGILEIAPGGAIGSTSGITLAGSTAELKYNAAAALTQPLTLTQGIISGTGTIGTAVTFASGNILSPGNSPGTQAYTSLHAWSPGGTYQWELNALTGTAGAQWDLVDITSGTFDLSALGTAPGSKFILDLVTLDLLNADAAGPLASPYDGGSYTFRIASYNPSAFSLPATFSNTAGADLTGLFQINLENWQGTQPQLGNISVKINSTATGIDLVIVPEPCALALAGLGMAAAVGTLLRRRKAGTP